MKKTIFYIGALLLLCGTWFGCKRDTDYIGVTVSPFISNFDLRRLFKNTDLELNTSILGGANSIKGLVISDPSSGNVPSGLLILQNSRISGNGIDSLRGIAVNIGATEAAKYVPGDSVHIKIDGTTLKRTNGVLQIQGVLASNIQKMGSGRALKVQSVTTSGILNRPDFYECTLVTISKAVLEPEPVDGDIFAGNKIINDGFGKGVIHTEANAVFAKESMVPSANFTGIVFRMADGVQLWPRILDDIFALPVIKPSAMVITGYLTDPSGSDANNEYIQLKATRDIDFAATPFSVVTCNNAGILTPPTTGWAFGGVRSYKFNISSGTVKKGQFLYVGGNKRIWGSGSTDISSAVWISSTQYSTVDGADFGTATSNLLANSGNVAGIAVFSGIKIDGNSIPLDVIMYGGNGAVYAAGPPEVGYRITNTDNYNTINPLTRKTQGFYGGGTNTVKFAFPSPTGYFTMLGGVYDAATGLWSTGRTAKSIELKATSPLSTIEETVGFTTIKN